ncbi:MAG: GAF domain-containing protein [Rubrivivax sp.]
MRTFIRAAEFWLPDARRGQLEYGGGLHRPGSQMARASRDMVFGRGEGLPGRAWDEARPLVLHGFEGSYFKRTAAAQADGLRCGIALPLFLGEYLSAVAVFFCGDDDDQAGAIEVWHNDPATSKDMTLADGHYGRTADTFEYLSRRTSFRPGTGLPGMAWQRRAPVFLPDLGRSSGFLRSDSAVKVGINRGFAIPSLSPTGQQHVLAFLSALGTPIARRVEVWQPDGDRLYLASGFCEQAGLLGANSAVPLQRGQGAVGLSWLTGLPTLGDGDTVVLPVLADGRFVAAVVFGL